LTGFGDQVEMGWCSGSRPPGWLEYQNFGGGSKKIDNGMALPGGGRCCYGGCFHPGGAGFSPALFAAAGPINQPEKPGFSE